MLPITKEIRYAVVLITLENKRKIKKLAVLRLDLSFLLKSVYWYSFTMHCDINFLAPN